MPVELIYVHTRRDMSIGVKQDVPGWECSVAHVHAWARPLILASGGLFKPEVCLASSLDCL